MNSNLCPLLKTVAPVAMFRIALSCYTVVLRPKPKTQLPLLHLPQVFQRSINFHRIEVKFFMYRLSLRGVVKFKIFPDRKSASKIRFIVFLQVLKASGSNRSKKNKW